MKNLFLSRTLKQFCLLLLLLIGFLVVAQAQPQQRTYFEQRAAVFRNAAKMAREQGCNNRIACYEANAAYQNCLAAQFGNSSKRCVEPSCSYEIPCSKAGGSTTGNGSSSVHGANTPAPPDTTTIDTVRAGAEVFAGVLDILSAKRDARNARAAQQSNKEYGKELQQRKEFADDIDKQMLEDEINTSQASTTDQTSDANQKLRDRDVKFNEKVLDCRGKSSWIPIKVGGTSDLVTFGYELTDFEDCVQKVRISISSRYQYQADISYKLRLTSNNGETYEIWQKVITHPERKGWVHPVHSLLEPFSPKEVGPNAKLFSIRKIEMLEIRVINIDLPTSPTTYIGRDSGLPWVKSVLDVVIDTGSMPPAPKFYKADLPNEVTFPDQK